VAHAQNSGAEASDGASAIVRARFVRVRCPFVTRHQGCRTLSVWKPTRIDRITRTPWQMRLISPCLERWVVCAYARDNAIGRSCTMAGLYYEEFFIGQEFEHPWTRTVTEMDNTLFSALTLNVQPLHLDAHFAAETEFGQRIVNSMFTAGLMVGMSVNDTTVGTTVGNLGFTDMRFPKPVFHGDTLRARTKVVAMRESRSRPDVGIVDFEHTCWNQRDEMVAICRRQAMMRKKPG
jgi:acyl dehydratase